MHYVIAGVVGLISGITSGLFGVGGGLVMVLFFAAWPRIFGRRHLGRIQGVAQAITVLASALGPLLLAWCVKWTGSYATMFQALAAVIALVGVAALLMTLPPPWPRVTVDLRAGDPEMCP